MQTLGRGGSGFCSLLQSKCVRVKGLRTVGLLCSRAARSTRSLMTRCPSTGLAGTDADRTFIPLYLHVLQLNNAFIKKRFTVGSGLWVCVRICEAEYSQAKEATFFLVCLSAFFILFSLLHSIRPKFTALVQRSPLFICPFSQSMPRRGVNTKSPRLTYGRQRSSLEHNDNALDQADDSSDSEATRGLPSPAFTLSPTSPGGGSLKRSRSSRSSIGLHDTLPQTNSQSTLSKKENNVRIPRR